jgi:hypothetical protein
MHMVDCEKHILQSSKRVYIDEKILLRIIELHKNKNKGKEKYQKIIVSFTMNEWP